MRYYLLTSLLCFSCLLFGQNQPTILTELQAGKTLRLEWVHQQYLPDSGSVVGDYPLFPDQLKDGEGESFIGLRLKMEECPTNNCAIKIWIEYVSSLTFPARGAYNENGVVWERGTPPTASLFPKIEDTRYLYRKNDKPLFVLGSLDSIPLIFDFIKGIEEQKWKESGLTENNLPPTFNFYFLNRFLQKIIKEKWSSKEYFQRTEVFEQFDKVSANFYKPIYPPQKTIITGKVSAPRVDEVDVSGLFEGSHIRTFGKGELPLNDDGTFKLETMLDESTIFQLRHEWNALELYLEPGDSIHLEIDANAFYRRTTFSGDQVKANQFLLDFFHEVRGDSVMNGLDRNLLQKTQLGFLKEIQAKEQEELAFLADHQKHLSAHFASQFDRRIRLEHATNLWYNGGWFYRMRDATFHPTYLAHCQSLRKYLFRLPNQKYNDNALEQYLDFQMLLLQGTYTSRRIAFRNAQVYELAKMLLSAKNAFRVGRFLLSFGYEPNENVSLDAIYEELSLLCKDPKDLKELADYKNPILSLPPMQGSRMMPIGYNAPDWAFKNTVDEMVQSTNFLGSYLLLHIGVLEDLSAAKSDLRSIKKEIGVDLKTISIVQGDSQVDNEKYVDENVLLITAEDMQVLRDSYYIDNQGNNFYLINSAGMIVANPMDLNSFHKLKSAVAALPRETPIINWQPSSIFWRNLGFIALFLLLLLGIYTQRKRTLAKREQQKRQLVELELKGIRAQMNPHFLFNALSSIQNLIRKKEEVKADRYLTQFAGLVRKILRNSEQEFITLEEEVAAIEQYCSLEALRTPFDYEINIATEVDAFNTYIPGMLLQPLIENAILHGLMPQQGKRNLWINIQPHSEGLACEIIDNGIGLNKSMTQKQVHKAHQKSFGVALIKQRLALLNEGELTDNLRIIDRKELESTETGTIVNLIIPIEK